jgi:hypothetical protein
MTYTKSMLPPRGAKEEAWHRRHAVMLASQLPECTDDALIILRLTAQLVTDFLTRPELRDCATTQQSGEAQKPTPVVAFVRAPGDASRRPPLERANSVWSPRNRRFAAGELNSLTR